jgi:uncharacterized protein YgiM (DUF1202 family)
MIRKAIAVALLCLFCVDASVAQQLETVRAVNVRSGPSVTSSVKEAVDSGSVVSLLSSRSGYDRVELADHTKGWIYARFLRATQAKDSTAGPIAPLQPGNSAIADAADKIASLPKKAPEEANDATCANVGAPTKKGSPIDTTTNLLKNRIDDGAYQQVSFGAVLQLPWQNLPRRRYQWTPAELQETAKYERAAVNLVGYIVDAKLEGPETTNCELSDNGWHDWHVWLVETLAEAKARDRLKAVVVEVTPRVRSLGKASLDFDSLKSWSKAGKSVRVSGWLMLDPEHPDQVGKTRGTTWEVHPVMEVKPVP